MKKIEEGKVWNAVKGIAPVKAVRKAKLYIDIFKHAAKRDNQIRGQHIDRIRNIPTGKRTRNDIVSSNLKRNRSLAQNDRQWEPDNENLGKYMGSHLTPRTRQWRMGKPVTEEGPVAANAMGDSSPSNANSPIAMPEKKLKLRKIIRRKRP